MYTIQSKNYPTDFWNFDRNNPSSALRISTRTPTPLRLLQPGLSGLRNTVSFEDVSKPGYYVVFQPGNSKVYMRALTPSSANFKSDASFFIRTDRFYPQSLSFEPCSASGGAVRHSYDTLYGHQGSGGLFANDATWYIHKQGEFI